MKILKDTNISLLVKSFLLDNQDYLSVSILYYFDLNNPDVPLLEQVMYRETAEMLGKEILDYAMPKQKAEVLLYGSCYNHTPQEGASHVRLICGDVKKELYVFGDRRWENTFISKPKPFKKMPLIYDLAVPRDENLLPNIEDPKRLMVDKTQKIKPAGFMPQKLTSKENMKKLGTYDEKWKKELWPGFAKDMDYTFFNIAPLDQQSDDFFQPSQEITLVNMHPDKQKISSKIPDSFVRCFITKQKRREVEDFVEVSLKRDTIWLFPEIQRGLIIFRGVTEIADEVYGDVKYLNIKTIKPDENSKTLKEYYELQKEELKRKVPQDNPATQEAKAKIKIAKDKAFDIPRNIKESIAKTNGKRPTLKYTLEEKESKSLANVDKALQRIESSEPKLAILKEKFGHITKIDLNAFEKTKLQLHLTKDKISQAINSAKELTKEKNQALKEADDKLQTLKDNPNISEEKKATIDFDAFKDKEKGWSDFAFDFLCESVKYLQNDKKSLATLQNLGLSKQTIKRSWIGYNATEQIIPAKQWGLSDEKDIILKQGFVLSRFEDAKLVYLNIENKIILGSKEEAELILQENDNYYPLFYFKDDDIQSYLLDQEVYDICNVLSCKDISKVSKKAKEMIENASVVFYLQEDENLEKLPNSKKFELKEYEDIFDLHKNKIDIREEFIKNLTLGISLKLPLQRDYSASSIIKKTKIQTEKLKDELKQQGEDLKKEMLADAQKSVEKANLLLKEKGLEPIDLSKKSPKSDMDIKPSEVEEVFDKNIAKLKDLEKTHSIDLSQKIKKLEEEKIKAVQSAKKCLQIEQDGLKKLEIAKKKLADPFPDWAKKKMKEAGIDPQNPHGGKLTVENVVKICKETKSLVNKNLSNLDLSNLDLSGVDLRRANLKETNLSGANLSGAILDQANCIKTDFKEANLTGVSAKMTIFKDTKLEKTVFKDADLQQAFFEKADMKETLFRNVKAKGLVFKDIEMQNCTFEDCDFENPSFIKTLIKESTFKTTTIKKPSFNESILQNISFIQVVAKSMLFFKSHAKACDFSNSDIQNLRVLKESTFTDCLLNRCEMQKTSIIEAVLENNQIRESILDNSLIRKSKLNKCDFSACVAKKARYEYSELFRCNFKGINLFKGSLRGVDMKECDFSHSNLYSVEFYKTKQYEVKFDGANLKRSNLEDRLRFIND